MASRRSLYEVLNVSADAEPVVIEAAYRALMKKYHPDQAPAPAAAGRSSATEINQAFAILRDPGQRADYDRREGARNQAYHLAAYQAPPPPRRSAFGWAGWFVAVLLGGILYVLIEGQGGIVPPAAGLGNAGGESAEFDHRSQPEIIPPYLASPVPTAIDREIMAREAAAAKAAAAARRARKDKERSANEPDILDLPPVAALPAEAAYRPVRRAPRRRGAPRPAEVGEEDFLKREGYVY